MFQTINQIMLQLYCHDIPIIVITCYNQSPSMDITRILNVTGLVGKSLGNHGFFPMKYSEILGHKQIAFQSSVKGIVSMSKLEVSSMSYCVYIYIYIYICVRVYCAIPA